MPLLWLVNPSFCLLKRIYISVERKFKLFIHFKIAVCRRRVVESLVNAVTCFLFSFIYSVQYFWFQKLIWITWGTFCKFSICKSVLPGRYLIFHMLTSNFIGKAQNHTCIFYMYVSCTQLSMYLLAHTVCKGNLSAYGSEHCHFGLHYLFTVWYSQGFLFC